MNLCVINGCGDPASGLIEWPELDVRFELCERHADIVADIERNLESKP